MAIIRMVFFGTPASNEQYAVQREILRQKCSPALVTYVSQKPMDGTLALEVQAINSDGGLKYGEIDGVRYIRDRDILYSEGIFSNFLDVEQQSTNIFGKLKKVLESENMPINSIVRQWNFIEGITKTTGGKQHYQEFNDSRSAFYAAEKWPTGYPAATGIGTDFGGVVVEVDAYTSTKSAAIDNPMQVAAHSYSKEVLIGGEPSTPKFERAKFAGSTIYISGTAAIRGEESLAGVGIEDQTRATLENIEHLISQENLSRSGIFSLKEPWLKLLRVYLKRAEDYPAAKVVVDSKYSTIKALYVVADICREELLVEIEGIA